MNKDKHIMNAFEPEKIDFSEADAAFDEYEYEKASELEQTKRLKYKQQKQMHDMVDTQYYACVIFANKADKEKWFETLGNIEIIGNTFIDGYQLAKNMGVKIEMTATLPEPHYVKQLKIKKK
jgi:hypothetical protein